MNKGLSFLLKIFAGLALAVCSSAAAFSQDFYKGKTIRFVVGSSAGGGFDTYTRAIARHMGKHIPGNPTTVVENMPGAGSLLAANYVYKKPILTGLRSATGSAPLFCSRFWARGA